MNCTAECKVSMLDGRIKCGYPSTGTCLVLDNDGFPTHAAKLEQAFGKESDEYLNFLSTKESSCIYMPTIKRLAQQELAKRKKSI